MTSAREYHDRSKHSVASVHASTHQLDWANQPVPFKLYRHLEPIALPRDLGDSDVSALTALAAAPDPEPSAPDRRALARLLHFSAGVTRTRRYPGGQTMSFRAAACTGALYHIDLYLVCGPLPDLAAGVYHFGPHDFALRRLREGDHRAVLIAASGDEPAVAVAPAVLVCTSTFWRNAWKYQARAYRHCFWDNGTILANLLAVAAADRLATRVVVGFVDQPVNALLGLDVRREVALSLVPLGGGAAPPPPAPPQPPLALETEPLSAREVDYPLIRAAHAATSLADPAAVTAWRKHLRSVAPRSQPPASDDAVILRRTSAPPPVTVEAAILRRGSTRRFSHDAIGLDALASLAEVAARAVPMDCGAGALPRFAETYAIVHGVQGVSPGTYVLDPGARALAPLEHGEFRREAGYLDLGQELAADAAVNVYLLADLDRVLAAGDRGYRAAQLEAAIVGGRLYLAAYALGLGATGLTFFDDEVTRFFSPHAAGKDVMFLLAAGAPARRR